MDLEGVPFACEQGLHYLFGFAVWNADGELSYEKQWALNRDEEKKRFEWLVDEIKRRREADSKMHVYHFAAYEYSTVKRLKAMQEKREDVYDRMLHAGELVDLHHAFKQGVRANVDAYCRNDIEASDGC